MHKPRPRGFVALLSAIIVGAALMAAAASAGLSQWYARLGELDALYKSHSEAFAESCAQYAALAAATDRGYAGAEVVAVGDGHCAVGPVARQGVQVAFQAQGIYQDSYSDLSVTAEASSGAILSEREVSAF